MQILLSRREKSHFMGLGCPTTNSEDEWKEFGLLHLDSAIPADGSLRKYDIYI